MRRELRRAYRAKAPGILAVTLLLALSLPRVAYADNVVASGGDGITAGQTTMALGNVCANTMVTKNVNLAISRNGGGNVYPNGATVTVSVALTTGISASTPGGSIILPSNWNSQSNGTLSPSVTSSVTYRAGGSASGATIQVGSVIYNATGGGLTRSVTINVTANVIQCDTIPPMLSLPANITAEAASASGAVVTYTATATDNVDGTDPVSCDKPSGATFPLGTTTVNCSATDKAGNKATGSFTVKVQDTTPPVIANLPTTFSVEATGPSGATATYTNPTANDAVDGPVSVSCAPASGSTFALGQTTVTCSASDKSGNTASSTFSVKVQDSTAPALVLPGNQTAEATGATGATVAYSASATDLVDGAITPSCTPGSGATFPLGTTTLGCSATDKSGNTGKGSFSVTVRDTTAPTVKVPANITAEATDSIGAAVTYTASASDVVDGSDAVSCSPASGSVFPLGTTTVTCSSTDAHGNTGSASFKVTVADTTPPHLMLPADQVLEATGPSGAVASFTSSATDAVDGNIAVTCTDASGNVVTSGAAFPIGATTITCAAVDNAGNKAQGSFTIKVQDTTAPALTLPGDITAEATGATGAKVTYTASASDLVDGTDAVSCSTASGATFPLGTTTVSCSATDAAGNRSSGSFKVTVQDTTAPTIADMTNVTAEAASSAGAMVTYSTPGASDLVDGTDAVSCDKASGSTFPLGTTTITCSTKDAAGNAASKGFTILVQDTTAPVLVLPSNIVAEAAGSSGAAVTYVASASDAVDGVVTPSCSPASGSIFALDALTAVTCSATDAHNNTAQGTFTVDVQDTTPPTLTVPADITAEATGPHGAAVAYDAPTATDLVDGTDAVTCDHASGDIYALGTTTVTCSATDAHGNTSSKSFTVTVVDSTPPDLKVPADQTAEATGPDGATVSYATAASDLVDGTDAVSCSTASGTTFPLGTTTVTCSSTDAAGNTGTASFNVAVLDTTPPALTLPQDIVAEATGPSGASVSYQASANDLVDGAVAVSCDHASGDTFALGTTTVTCSATDAHGNKATDHVAIKVQDTTPPQISGNLADLVDEATGPDGAKVSYATPGATDLVDGPMSVSCTPASGSTFPLDVSTTVTCSSTDKAGNTGTASFTVKVQDTTAPVLSLPQDLTDEATGPSGALVSYSASADDLVDGSVTPLCDPTSGSTFALGGTTVGCSATDKHSNMATGSFKVTVQDTTPPVLTVSGDKTAEAVGPGGAKVSYDTPSAVDLVAGAVAASCDKASGSTFSLGDTTVTCTAADAHGNKATASFKVTVVDTTPPALTQPDDLASEATGPKGAAVAFTAPIASDLVDGTDAVTCDASSGDIFALGTTTVTCSSTDAHTNMASVHFNVTVVDTTPPALSVPADSTAEATGPDGAAVSYTASAGDLVAGAVTPNCSTASGSTTSGTTFPLGQTRVTCTATDAHGNTSSKSFTVTVQDTTPPAITGTPADLSAEATGPDGARVTYAPPAANDLVDGAVTVACAPASGSTFALGTTTVTCAATDMAGNTSSKTFAIAVKDTTAPLLSLPKDVTVEATGATGATVTYSPSATDLVDGPTSVSCTPASGATFALDTTTAVTCSTSDKQGNSTSGAFKVTVVDTTPPALTLANDITAQATGPNGAAISYKVSAMDLVDGAITPSCSNASGSTFALGATTVTCMATDKHGNTAIGSFTVTVVDTTAPKLTLPGDITTVATSATGTRISYVASASDLVDGAIAPTCSPVSGSLFAPGVTTVTCSATDRHGNTATGSFKVTVTFSWSGVLPPIDPNGTSVFKQGSTIPVKFQLTGASAGISTGTFKLYWAKITNSVAGTDQQAVSTSAADVGNTFRYDASANQYIFNMNTKGLTPGTYRLRIDLGDGVLHTVQIGLQ